MYRQGGTLLLYRLKVDQAFSRTICALRSNTANVPLLFSLKNVSQTLAKTGEERGLQPLTTNSTKTFEVASLIAAFLNQDLNFSTILYCCNIQYCIRYILCIIVRCVPGVPTSLE